MIIDTGNAPLMFRSSVRTALLLQFRPVLLLAVALLVACQTTPEVTAPLTQAPIATHVFTLADDQTNVVGRLQITHAHAEDTLSDIARRFNLGYEEIVRANPGVDPWLPREGTAILLPTQFVLPDGPREGLVINLAALRLYYFPPRKDGEPQTVITHPIGIGMVGWSTPIGTTRITKKRKDPAWHPPASVRREHAAEGDILPARVEPGPDNPLGRFALNLDWPSYLIHGTNQPYGIGVRASHGCIRLYPEDIAQLYDDIPLGAPVTVVNQPQVYGRHADVDYLQSYPVMEDYAKKKPMPSKKAGKKSKRSAAPAVVKAAVDAQLYSSSPLVAELLNDPRGIAIPISTPEMNLEKVLGTAIPVENKLPDNATWDGND